MREKRARILLVEDEPDLGELLTMSLKMAGYDADFVTDAATARRRLESMRYDLVISDWRLPDGDGLALVDHAAALGSKTMIISAYLFQISDAPQRHEYMMKPMRPREFAGTVARLLNVNLV
jgi:DNA-binding response OmpR family regulator